MAVADCPLDEVNLADIGVQHPGWGDRGWLPLPCEPLLDLHHALHSWPLLDKCKGGVNGQQGSGDGVTVQHKAAEIIRWKA